MGIVKYIYGGNEQCCDRSLVEAIFRRQLRFPSWQNVRMYTYAWRLLGKHKLLDPRNQKLQNKRDKRNNTSLRRKVQKPLDSIAMGPCSQVKDLKSDCIQVLPERKQYTLKKKKNKLEHLYKVLCSLFFSSTKIPRLWNDITHEGRSFISGQLFPKILSQTHSEICSTDFLSVNSS